MVGPDNVTHEASGGQRDDMPIQLEYRLRRELEGTDTLDRFPMPLLLPHEAQCVETHGQTLTQLRARGGISPVECLAILEGWNPVKRENRDRETDESALLKLSAILDNEARYAQNRENVRPGIRRFVLNRIEDETGVSGTGIVAFGCKWPDGGAALRWAGEVASTAVYADMRQLERIHGHGGKTVIEWLD